MTITNNRKGEQTMMFITLEGGEGSGKTTQMVKIGKFLESKGSKYIVTREPGGTEIGAQIRRIVKNKNNTDLTPEAELLLYMADRVQHIQEIIAPALTAGKVVLCDRYYDSTSVYQGTARGLELNLINQLHSLFYVPIPDITFLLDLSPEIGLLRAWSHINAGERDKTQTRFEYEKITFHNKVREGYLKLAKKELHRFCVINAEQEPNAVWQDIKKVLEKFF
ncbi:MAG: dTMP kinase [Patescibacteria group bacterium]